MISQQEKTQPKRRFPKGYEPYPSTLAAGRYGTLEMVKIWGPEKTFECSLKVQGQSALTLSELHPEIIPYNLANEIAEKASLDYINPNRIRELEKRTGHDVIAINTALEEVLSPEARVHVNKAKTSADTTQPARALQIKDSLGVIADSVENLRDIVLEKSMEWIGIPHMDTTHLYDALPTVAGRPLAHYGEMLQYNLNFLKFVYYNSIIGKWADATGNHHSATALGIDGIKLQEKYCKDLEIGFMDAPGQIPGLEFEADVFFRQLLDKNKNNKMAFEYMMAFYLLTGQTGKIVENIGYLNEMGYERLPQYYEEAIAMYTIGSGGKNMDLHGWQLRPETIMQYQEFNTIYALSGSEHNKQNARAKLVSNFGKSYFFYFVFELPKAIK